MRKGATIQPRKGGMTMLSMIRLSVRLKTKKVTLIISVTLPWIF